SWISCSPACLTPFHPRLAISVGRSRCETWRGSLNLRSINSANPEAVTPVAPKPALLLGGYDLASLALRRACGARRGGRGWLARARRCRFPSGPARAGAGADHRDRSGRRPAARLLGRAPTRRRASARLGTRRRGARRRLSLFRRRVLDPLGLKPSL